jgi:hypothetical protein
MCGALGVPPSFFWDNTMCDFLCWIEGYKDKVEAERHFSMYQTSLIYNTLRNQWGDNGTVTVEELLGKKKEEDKVKLSDFANEEQFKEYMRERRRDK